MKTNTDPIWKLRDEIIDARIDAAGISDVLTRYNVRYELFEQSELLAELAEAIEVDVTEWWDVNFCTLHSVIHCQIMAERDPRTPVQIAADEQDADAYDQIADARRENRFGVGL